ncbi:peptidase T [Clostridium malenominatum]|uniref:Peptidase T n=1 Tax=Clostridium malenominatum TaxID=1539 RepID=A0ABP3UFP7_9CLOT
MNNVVEKFLKYVKYNTKSDENSNTYPSTSGQLVLAKELEKELKEIGLSNVQLDEYGYVFGELPSNIEKEVPTVGFIAHMDTSPDLSGENVTAKIVENYDGGDISLNKDVILSPQDSPELKNYIGKTLITTDGTTLLGADNKAGIAEIVAALEHLCKNPTIPHGKILVAFTPDEEVGEGTKYFDLNKFKADFAYTIDGGPLGELEYENFNAAGAEIVIKGRNFHPGAAKNKMINSMKIATELINSLPKEEAPEHTEGYEGFYHLTSMVGEVEETKLSYIIRDFHKESFQEKKDNLENIVKNLNNKYGEGTLTLEIKDQYYNMREKIEPVKYIVDIAYKAMEETGVTPQVLPIRGGTDGARLSFMGLPTPNIFTGGHNFHGRFEYIPTFAMDKAVEVILKIVELTSKI